MAALGPVERPEPMAFICSDRSLHCFDKWVG
jgi:hypothetical protein